MGFLRRLFGRRPKLALIDEREAYARSYGKRSGELLRVEPMPPTPEPPSLWEDLTGEVLRRAFERRLDARSKH
jgi:hypothetical protein